ncbi:hypothetical protein ACJMK2_015971 [Sinanodonta woodiana]|uniref:Uncharacterized protein n=1 Tax=Sinanodonta woodiana TaxID=1069815 RepID=A0ABD3US57_SINWO
MMYLARHCLLVILFYAESSGAIDKCNFGAREKLCKRCCVTDCCESTIHTLPNTLLNPEGEATGGNVFGRHGNIIVGVVGGWIAFIAVFAIFTVCFFAYRRKKNLNDGGEYTLMREAPVAVQIEYCNAQLEEENKKEESFLQCQH